MRPINNADFLGMLFRAGASHIPDNIAALTPELNEALGHVKSSIMEMKPELMMPVGDENLAPDGEFEFDASSIGDFVDVDGIEV